MKFYDKNVLVCGMARSGVSASLLLAKLGANVTIQDFNGKQDNNIIEKFKKNNIKILLGENPSENIIDKMDYVVISPGIPMDIGFVEYAKKKSHLMGELELAYLLCKNDILAITGTNGKTTTTHILSKIMNNYTKCYIAGNIGIPFSEIVHKMKKNDVVALEVSSFQLESIEKFRPFVCAVLNVSEDHLNRHKTMKNYINAKGKIFENQIENDFLVLNYDDHICREMSKKAKSKVVYFSSKHKLEKGAYLQNGYIYVNNKKFINIDELKIFGEHNIENVMASILIAICYNTPYECIKKGIKDFGGVEHRIEYVCTKNGVDYFNDSKGTNVNSTIKAIKSMVKPTYLILGGADKNTKFAQLIKSFDKNIKQIVLIGEVKEKLAQECDEVHYSRYVILNDINEAIRHCYDNAKSNECVLLSPACASFDMFKDYEERGNMFKQYVKELRG